METNIYSSCPNDFDDIIRRNILIAIRNGKFIYQGMEIKHASVEVNISEIISISNDEKYNYQFCGTAKFTFLKEGEKGLIDSTHYTFEGYACAKKTQIISLSDIICTKKTSF